MYKKIITLGPQGTFSDAAARAFVQGHGADLVTEYRGSIDEVFLAFDKGAAYCVLPIENLSEGHIPLVLDNIQRRDLFIVWEHLLPVRFSFVSKCAALSEVREVYAQFVARGQCATFLCSLRDAPVTTTQSNIESLHRVVASIHPCGAIVPGDSYEPGTFAIELPNVTDRPNNATRFIAVSRQKAEGWRQVGAYKTSLIVKDGQDRPGELSAILKCFATRGINLLSIVSRPTGNVFGEYSFYIDVDGHTADAALDAALNELSRHNTVHLLGSYIKSHVHRNDHPLPGGQR